MIIMDKDFSTAWKASKQPRKQRKYIFNMPLHLKGKFVSVHLSLDLRKKYGMRSIRARKGDKVKVVRGQHKGKKGKVESVNLKDSRITISGIEVTKKDGTKSHYPFQPSNLIIEELDLSDKKRMKTNKTGETKVEAVVKEKPKAKTAPKPVKTEVKKETPKIAEKKEIKQEVKKEEQKTEEKKELPKKESESKPEIKPEVKEDKK